MAQANIKAVITAEDRASSTIGGVGTSFTKMAGAVAVGQLAVTAFTSAASKLLDAGKFAIQSASDFEQNRIAFETMLGSADKAKKLLKDVSDFAAKTPFELPEVVTGAKQLLAYNIEAEKLIPTFNALGNIAAGVGKDKLPQLILAFGQVRAAGKLTGNELRQFTEAGVPLLDELGKKFGKTAGEVKIMVEEGKVGFSDVEAALFGMSQEGGKFFNLMQRQSLTFGGVMSNLSDNFGKLAREIIGINDVGDIRQGSIFYYLSQGAQRFLTWLDANKDGIIAFFNNTFTSAVNTLRAAWDYLEPSFAKLGETIETKVYPTMYKLWKEVLEPMLPIIGAAFLTAIRYAIGAFEWLMSTASSVLNWLLEKWQQVKTFFETNPMAKAALEELGKQFGSTKDDLKKIWDEFKVFWKNNGEEIKKTALVIAIGVGAALFMITQTIRGVISAVKEVITWFNTLQGIITGTQAAMARVFLMSIPGMKLPGRAVGGPVNSNTPYIVGERGPELFVPNDSGRIIPNNQMTQGTSSSNTTININVGMMTGSATEQREAALRIFENLQDIANTKGRTVAQMIGA